jgi:arylsulfatase A-like enzyme
LDLLTELKLDSNTIVFFTSDNGGTSGEAHKAEFFKSNAPLRGQKTQLYEGGIRVPMIVRLPGKIVAGSTSAVPWSFCDFMPTAGELAGAKVPTGLDGMSMLPVLTGKVRTAPARLLYWEQYQFDRKANDLRKSSLVQAARFGEWKAIRTAPGAPLELYNLKSDISEAKNVASSNEALVATFNEHLRKAHSEPRPHNNGNFEFVR